MSKLDLIKHIALLEKKIIQLEQKEPKKLNCYGFVLIKEYPNCHKKLGCFEKYTSGILFNYPEFWKPVYEIIK